MRGVRHGRRRRRVRRHRPHAAVCSAPHPRWSRHSTRSTAAALRPNAATGCPRRDRPEQQVAEESGGGAVREDAIGTHGVSRPSGRVEHASLAGRLGSRAWRYVLTQGVRALVRRDRRGEFLAPGEFPSPVTVAGPRRIHTGFLFCRRTWLRQSTTGWKTRQLAVDLRGESVRRPTYRWGEGGDPSRTPREVVPVSVTCRRSGRCRTPPPRRTPRSRRTRR